MNEKDEILKRRDKEFNQNVKIYVGCAFFNLIMCFIAYKTYGLPEDGQGEIIMALGMIVSGPIGTLAILTFVFFWIFIPFVNWLNVIL